MASDVSNSLKSSTTEEIRLRNYRASLQQKNDMEIRDIESKQAEQIQNLTENTKLKLDDMKRAYEVQISETAEKLEERLHHIRLNGDERLENEKAAQEAEFQKTRLSSQQKIEEYKKNADLQLDKLRKETQATTEMMHDRAKKAAKKQKEGTPS